MAVFLGLFFILYYLLKSPHLINKTDFQVVSIVSYEQEQHIFIDADLKMKFPDVVVEALENGIPLTIAVEAQIYRKRQWWRDVIIKQSRQLFELRYHPLTNVHEIKNIATNERYSFDTRQDAMKAFGTIRNASLLKKDRLNKRYQYYVQIRLLLDINSLPSALRQVAALSSDWRLASEWLGQKIVAHELSKRATDDPPDNDANNKINESFFLKENLIEPVEVQISETPP